MRTFLSLSLILNLVLVVSPVMMICGGGAAAARRAIVIYGESGSGTPGFDTLVQENLGKAVLTPIMEHVVQTDIQTTGTQHLYRRDGIDPLPLTDPSVIAKLIKTLEPADLDAFVWKVRRQIGVPKTKVPARIAVQVLNATHDAFVASLDLFPDLLASLEPREDGKLPMRLAQQQIGRRLLKAHGETLALRALGKRHYIIGAFAIMQFFVFVLICSSLAWASRPASNG